MSSPPSSQALVHLPTDTGFCGPPNRPFPSPWMTSRDPHITCSFRFLSLLPVLVTSTPGAT